MRGDSANVCAFVCNIEKAHGFWVILGARKIAFICHGFKPSKCLLVVVARYSIYMRLSAPLSDSPKPVVLIGGGPVAWNLITVRGMHALQEADVILTDHLGPAPELDKLCDVDAKEIIDVSKLPYKKSVSQDRINELLVEYARAGKKVARL